MAEWRLAGQDAEAQLPAVGAGVVVVLFWPAKQGFVWYVLFAQGNIALYGALGAFLFFFSVALLRIGGLCVGRGSSLCL